MDFFHVHSHDHGISMMVGAKSYKQAAQIVADFIANGDPPGEGDLCCVEKLCAPEGHGVGHYTAMVGQEKWFSIRRHGNVFAITGTDRRKIKYFKDGGHHCPYCNSKEIDAESPECDGEISEVVICGDCGRTWTDIYRLQEVILK